jgi:hypothetical protein
MLSSFLGVLPILIPPKCALALSCDRSPIPLLCLAFNFHLCCSLVHSRQMFHCGPEFPVLYHFLFSFILFFSAMGRIQDLCLLGTQLTTELNS